MEIWSEIRREVLTGVLSKRAAIAKYGIGWHTLKKMLAHDEPPGYRQANQRPKPKLEPFLPVIRQILEDDGKAPTKQKHTAHRIFERLRDEHGYTGGETVVKDAVREYRISHREVFLPLSHPPGEAQVDFGTGAPVIGPDGANRWEADEGSDLRDDAALFGGDVRAGLSQGVHGDVHGGAPASFRGVRRRAETDHV